MNVNEGMWGWWGGGLIRMVWGTQNSAHRTHTEVVGPLPRAHMRTKGGAWQRGTAVCRSRTAPLPPVCEVGRQAPRETLPPTCVLPAFAIALSYCPGHTKVQPRNAVLTSRWVLNNVQSTLTAVASQCNKWCVLLGGLCPKQQMDWSHGTRALGVTTLL